MAIIGFFVALFLFKHFMWHLRRRARSRDWKQDMSSWCDNERWGKHAHRDWKRQHRRAEREARRWARRWGYSTPEAAPTPPKSAEATAEEKIQKRARRRAAAEVG